MAKKWKFMNKIWQKRPKKGSLKPHIPVVDILALLLKKERITESPKVKKGDLERDVAKTGIRQSNMAKWGI